MNASIPVYVTRKTADGLVAHYDAPVWATLLAMVIVWANVVVWGLISLVTAARYVL